MILDHKFNQFGINLESLLEGHTVRMTNTPKQTYSALKNRFKQIPHRVRDDNRVVVGGVVELGKPGVAAGNPHFTCSKYAGSNILLAFMMYRAICDEVSCISPFKQIYTAVIPHLMRDPPTDHTVRMTNTPEQTYSAPRERFKQIPHRVRDDN
ncbi:MULTISPECIES: hypothetical protein [unclassified Pseudoalteromonas]|uniref:hypothetical protein n=1 Tax=unclassified Pseudoalteromonas TaxID=194690 RepID=UPI00209817E0|nr:hypothetical protein [Pseudoalteromonas sp. XMcav2-N]MCO7188344.1 hypothetical protein [Pseudoalteromonas sp. XMcav2-N]